MKTEMYKVLLASGLLLCLLIYLFSMSERIDTGSYTSAVLDSSVSSETQNISLIICKKYKKSFRLSSFVSVHNYYLELENGAIITVTRDDYNEIEEGESYLFELVTTNTVETVLKPQIVLK